MPDASRRIYGQTLIGKLFFSGKIVIQRILDTVPVRIGHGIAVQHPLFLGDVVLPNLSRVTEHAFKQSAVDGGHSAGRIGMDGNLLSIWAFLCYTAVRKVKITDGAPVFWETGGGMG